MVNAGGLRLAEVNAGAHPQGDEFPHLTRYVTSKPVPPAPGPYSAVQLKDTDEPVPFCRRNSGSD
ncbi:Uncharacterised protein [Pannonibacter phragmitetus]|uniref:Uncharacterized protein n=1 Tax=Pannonibacter phragmitetus TaxID=121719 RepID=A0A378ZT25_9HYPH|nr:Uncharacterised protein [Pannonibacter phragmitetus]